VFSHCQCVVQNERLKGSLLALPSMTNPSFYLVLASLALSYLALSYLALSSSSSQQAPQTTCPRTHQSTSCIIIFPHLYVHPLTSRNVPCRSERDNHLSLQHYRSHPISKGTTPLSHHHRRTYRRWSSQTTSATSTRKRTFTTRAVPSALKVRINTPIQKLPHSPLHPSPSLPSILPNLQLTTPNSPRQTRLPPIPRHLRER
jgi:hypothetical protein